MEYYKGYRYPVEIIRHAVWCYYRFSLSLRGVEELLLARVIVISYESIRSWSTKWGKLYASRIKKRQAQPGDKWHIDEMNIKIKTNPPTSSQVFLLILTLNFDLTKFEVFSSGNTFPNNSPFKSGKTSFALSKSGICRL